MTVSRRSVRAMLVAASGVLAVGVLAGCAAEPLPASTPVAARDSSPALPPGDPGPDAPPAPDPLTEAPLPEKPADDHGHAPARAVVPAAAFPTTGDIDAFLGGRWREADSTDEVLPGCLARTTPPAGSAARTWRSDGDALVVHLRTYDGVETAADVVAATRGDLTTCGARLVTDPRLGSASVTAELDGERLLAVAAEGVVITLRADATRVDPVTLTSLADLAMGTSCEAAPDGCH